MPDLPTFWPAAVPNKVLTQQAYRRILDGGLGPQERQAAFAGRVPWARHLVPDYEGRIRQFVTDWPRLGLIEPQPGPAHDPTFPAQMHVERESGFPEGPSPHAQAIAAALGGAGGGAAPAGQTGEGLDAAAAAERDMPTQPPLDDWRAHL